MPEINEEDFTPETVRALIDAVRWGECVTFPNGLVVDKRPVCYPIPAVIQPTPSTTPGYPPTYPSPHGPNYSGPGSYAGQMTPMVDPYEAGRTARAASDG